MTSWWRCTRTANGFGPSRAIRCGWWCRDGRAISTSSGCAGLRSSRSRSTHGTKPPSYSDLRPDGKALQFTYPMDVKSVITEPSGGQTIAPGFQHISGLAWSGHGAVRRVEVSTDGGNSWNTAALDGRPGDVRTRPISAQLDLGWFAGDPAVARDRPGRPSPGIPGRMVSALCARPAVPLQCHPELAHWLGRQCHQRLPLVSRSL